MEGPSKLDRIIKSWERRCTVRRPFKLDQSESQLDEFPRDLVYFFGHPLIASQEDSTKKKLLAMAWIAYNERTIASEQKVANRAFNLIHDHYTGSFSTRKACLQSLIDEYWHTYLHTLAAEATRTQYEIPGSLLFPESVTVIALGRHIDSHGEAWKANLAVIVWAMVAEVSVNAYLNIIGGSEAVRPCNAELANFHNIDEYAHTKLFMEIAKEIFVGLSVREREFFANTVSVAHEAFCAQDDAWWEVILGNAKIKNPKTLLAESKTDNNRRFIRDFSSLEKIYGEMELKKYLTGTV